MTTEKKLGVWLDHSTAHFMEYAVHPAEIKTIESKFTHEEKVSDLMRSENLMHNHEQHQQAEYYKKLGEVIRKYDEVLLFGPTTAKAELLHVLRANHLFEKIKIAVENTDKLTENQRHAFVKQYFDKHIL